MKILFVTNGTQGTQNDVYLGTEVYKKLRGGA